MSATYVTLTIILITLSIILSDYGLTIAILTAMTFLISILMLPRIFYETFETEKETKPKKIIPLVMKYTILLLSIGIVVIVKFFKKLPRFLKNQWTG